MLLYGFKDRLARPGCEHGYRFLGPHRERTGGDLILAIVGSLLGAGLVAWGKQWMTQNFFRWVNLTCAAILVYFAFQLGVQTAQSLI